MHEASDRSDPVDKGNPPRGVWMTRTLENLRAQRWLTMLVPD